MARTADQEETFKNSKTNRALHKNLYYSLAYLHAILEGRRRFGSLGWNIPYKFDFADIELSESQLNKLMKAEKIDPLATLRMMKYTLSEINYGGRV